MDADVNCEKLESCGSQRKVVDSKKEKSADMGVR